MLVRPTNKLISNSKIIIICGPTCSGKTKFAIDVASQLSGEIVSADSMQIYRYMNIGTAKPMINEQTSIYHHMIDIVDPDENFDAAEYSKLARASIKRILVRKGNVFVVGGTGLYIKALIHGLFSIQSNNSMIRKKLKQQANKYGKKWLHTKLYKIDKISANRIHKNDVLRVIRALEVFEITGKSMTQLINIYINKPCFYRVLTIGLTWPRTKLYDRINQRVNEMFDQGFVDEVIKLLNSGYSPSLKSMNSLGYRHVVNLLKGINSIDDTIDILKRDHRRYAKRQLTWFNANSNIHWLKTHEVEKAVKIIHNFLQY